MPYRSGEGGPRANKGDVKSPSEAGGFLEGTGHNTPASLEPDLFGIELVKNQLPAAWGGGIQKENKGSCFCLRIVDKVGLQTLIEGLNRVLIGQ